MSPTPTQVRLTPIRLITLCALLGTLACGGRDCASNEPHTVTPAEIDSETAIAPEEGAIVEGALPPAERSEASSPAAPVAQKPKTKKPVTEKPATEKPVTREPSRPATSSESAAGSQAKPGSGAGKSSGTDNGGRPGRGGPPSQPKKQTLPSTAHVRYTVGTGMQKLIDKDPRIVSWLRAVTPVLDACYRRMSGSPSGTVQATVTMHASARPSVALKSLPGSLAGMMPCATSKLMGRRPPLFTGPEGQRHVVSIHFQ